MKIVLDTNILISFLTDRDLAQQAEANEIISSAASGEHRILLPQHVLTEMVFVLQNLYEVPAATCAEYLERLLAMPGVEPEHELSWTDVLDLWPKTLADFGDAIVIAACLRARSDALATFDNKLRKRARQRGILTL